MSMLQVLVFDAFLGVTSTANGHSYQVAVCPKGMRSDVCSSTKSALDPLQLTHIPWLYSKIQVGVILRLSSVDVTVQS